MKNLPTLEEILSFLKDNLKIISITAVSFLVLFIFGAGYTIYTDSKIEESVDETVEENENLLSGIDESIPLEEQLEPEEIELIVERLQEEGIAFSFYLEKDSTDPFQSPELLEEILTAPETIQTIEQENNIQVEPSPKLAVDVSYNSNNLLLTVTIGTGNVENNQVLAEAYYTIISNELNPFFDNKTVYIINEPERIVTSNESQEANGEIQATSSNNLSYGMLFVYAFIILVVGVFTGILIALIKSLFKKEVSGIYGFAIKDEDIILNLSDINAQTKDEHYTQIAHTILHPVRGKKLILSQDVLENGLVKEIEKRLKVQDKLADPLTSVENSAILFAQDIINVNPELIIDEIVFICKNDETTKEWYEKQRKLLEVYNTTVKVVLV